VGKERDILSETQMRASEMRPMESHQAPAPAHAEPNGAPRSFGEGDVATRLSTFSTGSSTCRKRKSSDFEPLPGFEPGTYGLRNRITSENPSEFSRSFNELPDPDADPRASSRILEHEPDGIALGLLEAQAVWISTQDRVRLRRALLGVLALLDD
jgi:hypothetical protein